MKQLLLCLFFIVLFGEFSFSQFPNGFSFTEKVVFPGQQKSIYLTHFFSTCIQPEYHYPKEILDSIGDFLKNNPEVSIEIVPTKTG